MSLRFKKMVSIAVAIFALMAIFSELSHANTLTLRLNTLDRAERVLDKTVCAQALINLRQEEMFAVRKYRVVEQPVDPQMIVFYLDVQERLLEAYEERDPSRYTEIYGSTTVARLYTRYMKRIEEVSKWLREEADSKKYPEIYAKFFRRTARNILPTPTHYFDKLKPVMNLIVSPTSETAVPWQGDDDKARLHQLIEMSYMVRGFLSELLVSLATPGIIGQNLKFFELMDQFRVNMFDRRIQKAIEEIPWRSNTPETVRESVLRKHLAVMGKEFDVIYEKNGVIHLGDVKFAASVLRGAVNNSYNDRYYRRLRNRVDDLAPFLRRLSEVTGRKFVLSFFFVGYGLPEDRARALENLGAVIEAGGRRETR